MKNKSIDQSFKNAFNGFCQAITDEHNMKTHVVAAIMVIALGILFNLDTPRWLAVIFAIGLVFASELFNTAIELLTDMVTAEYSKQAKKVKDISAAAVLVSAIISVIIGIIAFSSPIINLLKQI
ncbi:MAG TPA: diacylglycerol kinase family protein [Clostridiaceae bacterium]|jgi:diacylglycerol kinase|nr:diacylglycerol kinase family protein [Clostridiaceae bacterium]